MLINVLDYPTPQEAIDAASEGDRIYFPAGPVYEAPELGFQITKSLEIFGDGPGNPDEHLGTILCPFGTGNNVIVLVPTSAEATADLVHVYLHDLAITRRPGVSGYDGQHGICFDTGDDTKRLSELRLERVDVSYMQGDGIHLIGASGGSGAVAGLWVSDCAVRHCGGIGLNLFFAFAVFVTRSRFADNLKQGVLATEGEVAMYGCSFEANSGVSAAGLEAALTLSTLTSVRVDSCEFRGLGHNSFDRRGILLVNVKAPYVSGCSFENTNATIAIVGIDIAGGVASNDGGTPMLGICRFDLPRVQNQPENIAIRIANQTVGAIILPQYCNPDSLVIELPDPVSPTNPLTVAAPSGVPSRGTVIGAAAGLLVPNLLTNPPTDGANPAPGGYMAFIEDPEEETTALRVYALTGDPPLQYLSWHDVELETP